jgi:hypothetical protein
MTSENLTRRIITPWIQRKRRATRHAVVVIEDPDVVARIEVVEQDNNNPVEQPETSVITDGRKMNGGVSRKSLFSK